MGLLKHYREDITESEYLSICKKEKICRRSVLNFFGYKPSVEFGWEYLTGGGDITLTYEGDNTYKLGRTPISDGKKYEYYIYYDRSVIPSAKAENLEEQFMHELRKIKLTNGDYFWGRFRRRLPRPNFFTMLNFFAAPIHICHTPYISPNLKEYHRDYGGQTKFTEALNAIGRFMIKVPLLFLAIPIIYAFTNILDNIPDLMIASLFFGSPIIGCFLLAVSHILFRIRHAKVSKIPLPKMNNKYRSSLKKHYYSRMKYLYGRKMGNILREYSILKENNQHIL